MTRVLRLSAIQDAMTPVHPIWNRAPRRRHLRIPLHRPNLEQAPAQKHHKSQQTVFAEDNLLSLRRFLHGNGAFFSNPTTNRTEGKTRNTSSGDALFNHQQANAAFPEVAVEIFLRSNKWPVQASTTTIPQAILPSI